MMAFLKKAGVKSDGGYPTKQNRLSENWFLDTDLRRFSGLVEGSLPSPVISASTLLFWQLLYITLPFSILLQSQTCIFSRCPSSKSCHHGNFSDYCWQNPSNLYTRSNVSSHSWYKCEQNGRFQN
jgi:hypothetical protein